MIGAERTAGEVPGRWLARQRADGMLSRRGVERSGVVGVVGLKAMNIAQSVLVLSVTSPASGRLPLEIATLAVFTASGAVVAATGWRAQRLVGWAVALDVGVGLAVLTAAPLFQPANRPWSEWPINVTFLVAAEAAVTFRRLAAIAATLSLMAADASWLLWNPPSRTRDTALGAMVAYVGFAAVAAGFTWYLRKLADLADTRAETIRQLEAERTRRLLHTPYRLLNDLAARLGRESARDGDNPESSARLAEAVASVYEIEAVMRGTEPASGNLAADLLRLREQFADLPLVMNVEDAALTLPRETVYRVREAVRSALQNVRLHADAGSVVVYASADVSGWLVSVCDDGRGFDPTDGHGVGIRDVMIGALAEIGASVSIDTGPGRGTFIEFKGEVP